MLADNLVGRENSNHDSGNIPGAVEFAGEIERTELPDRHVVCERPSGQRQTGGSSRVKRSPTHQAGLANEYDEQLLGIEVLDSQHP